MPTISGCSDIRTRRQRKRHFQSGRMRGRAEYFPKIKERPGMLRQYREGLQVVLVGANYTALAPPHSFINALDFTPRELANYLKQLDADDRLYAEYFWWKPHYQVANLYHTNRQVFCHLCQALHYQVGQRPLLANGSTIKDVKKWYVDDSHCLDNPKFDET